MSGFLLAILVGNVLALVDHLKPPLLQLEALLTADYLPSAWSVRHFSDSVT